MHLIRATVPYARRLAAVGPDLSRAARQRLKWMDYYRAQGENAALTCRYFGISRQTFYRWRRRYDPTTLTSLEARSHRPHRRRRPTWSPALAHAVRQLRDLSASTIRRFTSR